MIRQYQHNHDVYMINLKSFPKIIQTNINLKLLSGKVLSFKTDFKHRLHEME